MHESWRPVFEPVQDALAGVLDAVTAERASGIDVLPEEARVLRTFEQPFEQVRVLIVGQDPYPTPGHPVGLAFSVAADVRPLPPSLRNILTEYSADLGFPPPANGDLCAWAERGVLLLNRSLTVRAGAAGSHSRLGWEPITRRVVSALAERRLPLVAMLWGAHAQSLQAELGATPIIASAHPSPLSAYRGFLGSRPFSRANELLRAQGAVPIDWSLTPQTVPQRA